MCCSQSAVDFQQSIRFGWPSRHRHGSVPREGRVYPRTRVVTEYLSTTCSFEYVKYLENKYVQVDACALDDALATKHNNVVDLLLEFGAPFDNSTY